MSFGSNHSLSVGSKVRVTEATEVPTWSKWDDDKGRTSPSVKRRLQSMFFKADRKVTAEIMYVGKESERDRLRRLGQVKVRLRDPSGAMLVITADPSQLKSVG